MAPDPGFHSRLGAALAEAIGTALLVLAIVLAAALSLSPGSPLADSLPGPGARFLALGLLVAPFVGVLAASPLGRISGAHLNPAVTLAFWLDGRTRTADVPVYVAAQLVGGLAGAAAGRALLPRAAWEPIGGAVTHPDVPVAAALALEAGMTALLLLVVLAFVSSAPRLTPLALVPTLTAIIWLGSPWTGASINPARSEGPALAFGDLDGLWIYLLAPSAAGLAVGFAWRVTPGALAALRREPDQEAIRS